MDALALIGEQRIREAVERGDLDDLPGAGAPLVLEDVSGIPEELRLGYLALRTSGWARRDLGRAGARLRLDDLLRCAEGEAPAASRRRLSAARFRLERLIAVRGSSAGVEEYRDAVFRQLAGD